MTDKYPFLFFNHGNIGNPEGALDKNAEFFLWFRKPVDQKDRARIMAGCPKPVDCVACFADRFVYFESHGDTFDFDVMEAYGDKKGGKANKASKKDASPSPAGVAVGRFVQAFEKWVLNVHEIAPLSFVLGMRGADKEDPWNQWSRREGAAALKELGAYAREPPDVMAADEDEEEDEEEEHPDAPTGALREKKTTKPVYARKDPSASAVRRYFGYIQVHVAHLMSETALPMETIESLYAHDGVARAFGRLDSSEHTIHSNAGHVLKYLEGASPVERAKKLAAFPPYVRLAYLASYPALKAEDPQSFADLPGEVKRLLESLPENRRAAGVSLTVMLAANLVHVTPAFSAPVKTHAALSAGIYRLVAGRKELMENDYVVGTVVHEWSKEFKEGLAFGEKGLKRFPSSAPLIMNTLAVANYGGFTDKALALTEMLSNAKEPPKELPDEAALLNRTFALIRAGKLKAALDVLFDFHAAGGRMTKGLYNNLFYGMARIPLTRAKEWPDMARGFLADMEKNKAWLKDVDFMLGASASLNTNGFAWETVKMLDECRAAGVKFGQTNLWNNYTYSALFAKDPSLMRHVISCVEKVRAEDPREVTQDCVGNLSAAYALAGEKDKALACLRELKKQKFSRLNEFKEDENLVSLKNDPEFQALFK